MVNSLVLLTFVMVSPGMLRQWFSYQEQNKRGLENPVFSHFCGIRLSEKRGGCRFFFKNVKVGLA